MTRRCYPQQNAADWYVVVCQNDDGSYQTMYSSSSRQDMERWYNANILGETAGGQWLAGQYAYLTQGKGAQTTTTESAGTSVSAVSVYVPSPNFPEAGAATGTGTYASTGDAWEELNASLRENIAIVLMLAVMFGMYLRRKQP